MYQTSFLFIGLTHSFKNKPLIHADDLKLAKIRVIGGKGFELYKSKLFQFIEKFHQAIP